MNVSILSATNTRPSVPASRQFCAVDRRDLTNSTERLGVTGATLLGCHSVLMVRSRSILENSLHRIEVVRVRIRPRLDVLFLDRHDAAIVTGGRDFGRRLISDCRE
jgi:hypothetical protein